MRPRYVQRGHNAVIAAAGTIGGAAVATLASSGSNVPRPAPPSSSSSSNYRLGRSNSGSTGASGSTSARRLEHVGAHDAQDNVGWRHPAGRFGGFCTGQLTIRRGPRGAPGGRAEAGGRVTASAVEIARERTGRRAAAGLAETPGRLYTPRTRRM